MNVLIVKLGALGDVLRTTSILPGLRRRHPAARITWLVARGGEDLVRFHPEVARVVAVEPGVPASFEDARRELARTPWDRILSFDDEREPCALAAALAGTRVGVLSGAFLALDGRLSYTRDTAPWFDMGLLSVFGKDEADQRKQANRASHAALFAGMLGIEPGRPVLPLPAEARAAAAAFAERHGLHARGPAIGLNTGAGGRWESKRLPVERTLALLEELARRRDGRATFLLLGGPDEGERNAAIRAGAGAHVRLIDAGVDHGLLEFAALVARLDVLVTSDSLALHVALATGVPLVAFFAPTSAAEIDVGAHGERVVSLSADAGSYRADADTSTLTVERLADAVERVLSRSGREEGRGGP